MTFAGRLLFGLVLAVGMAFTGTPAPPTPKETDDEKVLLQNRLVVYIQGIPGCGKSELAEQIRKHRTDTVTIELDTYKATHGEKRGKARKAFVKDYTNYLDNEEVKVVFVSMNNSNPKHYQDLLNIANQKMWKVMTINIADLKTEQEIAFILSGAHGALTRADHPTMSNTKKEEKDNVYHTVVKFSTMCQPAVAGQNGVHIVERLQWTKVGQTKSELYLTYDDYIKNGGEGFDARRPIEDIIGDVVGMIDKHIDVPMTINKFTPIEVNKRPNPEEMYMKLKLSNEHKEQLKVQFRDLIPEFDKISGKEFLSHVTMMHKNNIDENPKLWLQLRLAIGNKYTIVPQTIIHKENTVVVMVDIENENGDIVNNLVCSGFPHITAVLPSGVKAQESKIIAEEATPDDKIEIKHRLRFTSTLE